MNAKVIHKQVLFFKALVNRYLLTNCSKLYRENDIDHGVGRIFIDDLDCLGTESDISECKSREWGTHNCEHEEDVVITCGEEQIYGLEI